MVHHRAPLTNLDSVAAAISHRTRRAIIDRLSAGRTPSDGRSPFSMSLTRFCKHVRVLERAGLVRRTREAATTLSSWPRNAARCSPVAPEIRTVLEFPASIASSNFCPTKSKGPKKSKGEMKINFTDITVTAPFPHPPKKNLRRLDRSQKPWRTVARRPSASSSISGRWFVLPRDQA